jgi:hypothetical protein
MMTSARIAVVVVVALAGAVVSSGGTARADDTIKTPGDHPPYVVEIEPHALAGFGRFGGNAGVGLGARFSIPIVENGFVRSINNSVAIGFGADLFFVDHDTLVFPVVMQWNFFVHRQWSVFGEPGVAVSHSFAPETELRPVLYAGARYHFIVHAALTMRVGYPSLSVGLSFW